MIRDGVNVPDDAWRCTITLDLREEIIEAYGECKAKGRQPWDSWENHKHNVDGFTPYDMTREIIKVGYNECGCGTKNLDGWYGREFARREREEGVQAPADLVFQSLMWDLVKDKIFSKPEFVNSRLHSFLEKDGYVEVVIEENWRVRHNSHRP